MISGVRVFRAGHVVDKPNKDTGDSPEYFLFFFCCFLKS